jgi:iron(II)-dependent oxidoreductase
VSVRDALIARLEQGRAATLGFVEGLDDAELCAQPHPEFSPIGWHLGHVAFTEASWVLGRCGKDESLVIPHARRWAQGATPKPERVKQPSRGEILGYLGEVRRRVLDLAARLDLEVDRSRLEHQGYVLWFIAAHEAQHRETMAIVRQLELERRLAQAPPPPASAWTTDVSEWIRFAGGSFELGETAWQAYDNERPRHAVELEAFEIASRPVTVAEWDAFRADGGYERAALWSQEGWAWRVSESIRWPQGWTRDEHGRLARPGLDGRLHPLEGDEPVVGVSCHEADAFVRWAGLRLPREAEWEVAACRASARGTLGSSAPGPRPPLPNAFLGEVWEWTACPFAPYPGFEPWPYRGYSEPYFDGAHRVTRGGSFATDPSVARTTFRNWYPLRVRSAFTGLRCARSV